MKIKRDLLRIGTIPFDEKGQRIEPEQQPLQRVLTTSAPASKGGLIVGELPAEIIYNMTVGDFAGAIRTPCMSCKHFDTSWWLKMKARAEDPTGSKENRQWLNGIRANLLETLNAKIIDRHIGQDGDYDVEHALASMGICRPLTEIAGDAVIVYPTTTCPEIAVDKLGQEVQVVGPGRPNGFYIAKDPENERMGSKVYDSIMRKATGEE